MKIQKSKFIFLFLTLLLVLNNMVAFVAYAAEDTREFLGPVQPGESEEQFRQEGDTREYLGPQGPEDDEKKFRERGESGIQGESTRPPTIPCVPHLPCITEERQAAGGEAVRQHITDTFAVKFFTSFLAVCGVTAVIFLIVGGVQMHLAMGNEDAIKKAKTTIIWAIVGLVISILSVTIVRIVSTLFT